MRTLDWYFDFVSPYAHLIASFMGNDQALLDSDRACFLSLREETIAGASHMMHHDQPAAFARAIEAFMMQPSGRPGSPPRALRALLLSHKLDAVDAQLDGARAPARVDLPLQPDNLARRGDR
jgi:hypothetical protein